MTDAEINAMVRRLALTQNPAIISDAMLTIAKTEGIKVLAELLVAASPETFEKKVSIAADYDNTAVFSLPSDNDGIKSVWDYDGNAGAVTGAADNGSGLIRLTHNLTVEDEERVFVHDVGGCTEANGIWQVSVINSTTLDLVGSTFTNAFTSAGRIFRDHADTYRYPIERRPSRYQTGTDNKTFFLYGSKLIVDDPEFENDIIVLYRYKPSTLTEMPANLHSGIYAFATLMLAKLPEQGDELFSVMKKNLEICGNLWDMAQKNAKANAPIISRNNISKVKSINQWL